jgi:glycosyltransferase involved in cell wall biosynthesis
MRTASIGLVCLRPLPRYAEAMPVKLFEYMAAGLAVVASDFPLWREIVRGADCGLLVDSRAPRDISAALTYLRIYAELI